MASEIKTSTQHAKHNSTLNRKRAAEWLAQQLGDKDADQWKLWLRNNANTARKAVYRVETSTVGRSTFYSLDELARFLDWEKSRRIGEMKLDGRALEVMQAFGIGDPNVSGTTGRKLEVRFERPARRGAECGVHPTHTEQPASRLLA